MSLLTTLKVPHPIQDQQVADHNRRTICEVRGYCGPFINQLYYDQFPDPIWRGTGECIVCCNTCNVEVEEGKQRLSALHAVHVSESAPANGRNPDLTAGPTRALRDPGTPESPLPAAR